MTQLFCFVGSRSFQVTFNSPPHLFLRTPLRLQWKLNLNSEGTRDDFAVETKICIGCLFSVTALYFVDIYGRQMISLQLTVDRSIWVPFFNDASKYIEFSNPSDAKSRGVK